MADFPPRSGISLPLSARIRRLCLGTLFLLPVCAQAQQQQPVRRALPVEQQPQSGGTAFDQTGANAYENPAWMQRVRPALPATPAQPVATPLPNATPYRPPGYLPPEPTPAASVVPAPLIEPVPRQPAQTPLPATSPAVDAPAPQRNLRPIPADQTILPVPASTPRPTPQNVTPPAARAVEVDAGQTPRQTNTADPDGAIRIAPSAQENMDRSRVIQSPKDYADALYVRKMYDLAIPEYEKFLKEQPTAPARDAAWFRLAESYRNTNQPAKAREAYRSLVREIPKGEFAGAGAYRLGGMLMDEGNHREAAPNFALAAREAADPPVRMSALFFSGRALELAGDRRGAYEVFDALRSTENVDLRYKEYSLGALARIGAELGRKKAAVESFLELAELTENPKLQSEARVKAAELLMEDGKLEQARQLLLTVREDATSGEWGKAAGAGLLELEFQSNNFETVAAVSEAQLASYPPETQARARLLTAHANRQIGKFDRALETYDRILKEFPDTPAAKEARFHRLVCLFRLDDPRLVESLNAFLLQTGDPVELAQARLLKAETHYKAEQWADAASAFGNLRNSQLPEKLREDASFKYAWCLTKTSQPQKAVVAYSEFLERFPESDLAPQALVGRGMVHLENGAHDAATRDFERVVVAFPDSNEREFALLQRGLTWGARKDYAKMKADLELLIAEYPKTAARAQAEFWTGYAKFEEKDYRGAIEHFNKARELDPETYGTRSALRSMLANYYLEDLEGTAREVDSGNIPNVPAEVYQWLAAKYLETGDSENAEKYLQILVSGKAGDVPGPDLYLQLAESRIQQKKYSEAMEPITAYLEITKDPQPRARGLLTKARAAIGMQDFELARKSVEDAQLLQPEGRLNAEARMVTGELFLAENKYEDAAKTFLTVAVLYDDAIISPKALQSAANAYTKANNAFEANKALEELQRRYPQATQAQSDG